MTLNTCWRHIFLGICKIWVVGLLHLLIRWSLKYTIKNISTNYYTSLYITWCRLIFLGFCIIINFLSLIVRGPFKLIIMQLSYTKWKKLLSDVPSSTFRFPTTALLLFLSDVPFDIYYNRTGK